MVCESVSKTGRLVLVEESPFSGGWGTEIASYVASECFDQLKAPVLNNLSGYSGPVSAALREAVFAVSRICARAS